MFIHCNLYQQSQCHYVFFVRLACIRGDGIHSVVGKSLCFWSYPELYLLFFLNVMIFFDQATST